MPRSCTICQHEQREEIERALLTGEPFRKIAERSGTSVTSLHRHKTEHLTPSLVKASGAAQAAHGDNLAKSHETTYIGFSRRYLLIYPVRMNNPADRRLHRP